MVQQLNCHITTHFQSDAGWKVHMHTAYEKASNLLNIRMLKHAICREALIKIYISFIRPILEYGNIIWDNCSEKDAALLEDVQITAARIITGIRVHSSRTILFNKLGVGCIICKQESTQTISIL